MKKENNFLKFIILLSASFTVFVVVNFFFLNLIGQIGSSVGMTVLIIFDLFSLVFLPYIISRYLQRRDEKSHSEWIAGISHDIRTPLSLVLGSAGKIINSSGDASDVKANAETIKTQAFRIKELVTNLNTENLLAFGGSRKKENIFLAATLRDVFTNLLNATDSDKYEAVCNIAPVLEKTTVKADEGFLRRMFENLIGNAIRHNPNGCKINVSLAPSSKQDRIELTVSDDGEGTDTITLNMLNSNVDSITPSSHGMGLRVVKKIAKLYRWKIYFSSSLPNGFTVKILIPR